MRKILLILITTLLVFSLTGCEAKPKAETAYIEAFDKLIDLRDTTKIISPTSNFPDQSIEKAISNLTQKNRDYVVVRAECTGNWVQKNYENEDHKKFHKRGGETYTEIPFKIIKFLEGDKSILKDSDNLQLEIPELVVSGDEKSIGYNGTTHHFVYPRIGYEYILILEYHKETGCIALYTGGGIICELSKPEDYYKYWCTIHNKPIREEIDYDYGIPPMYYEALERYNIKVK